jgi:hypothetical protein
LSRSNWCDASTVLSAANTSAPEGRAALSSSALFQRAAELWVSTATAAASIGARP